MEVNFSIVYIRLIESHFSINQQYKWEKDKPIALQNSVSVKFKQTEKHIHLQLSVASDSENQPFRFSVSYEGDFSFEAIPPQEELERIANINCASMIFPYVRECIADMTRRAGLQPLNLPPFNFVAMYNENKKTPPPATTRKSRKKMN
jgi:preprotein translocase subunit SecB